LSGEYRGDEKLEGILESQVMMRIRVKLLELGKDCEGGLSICFLGTHGSLEVYTRCAGRVNGLGDREWPREI
jgi:hypothetical protein